MKISRLYIIVGEEALEMHFPLTKAIVQYEQCMLSYLDFNNKYDTIIN